MKFFYRIDEIFYYIFLISRLGFTQLVLIRFTSRQAIGGQNQCICACLFVSKYFDVVSFVLADVMQTLRLWSQLNVRFKCYFVHRIISSRCCSSRDCRKTEGMKRIDTVNMKAILAVMNTT